MLAELLVLRRLFLARMLFHIRTQHFTRTFGMSS
jgi:hypothetical protein